MRNSARSQVVAPVVDKLGVNKNGGLGARPKGNFKSHTPSIAGKRSFGSYKFALAIIIINFYL